MRRLALILAPWLLAACNANPLLNAASSDYAPSKVGTVWTYAIPGSATPFVRRISAELTWQGRDALQVDDSGPGAPATGYWSFQGGDWYRWDATLGWALYRRLPYVTGNSWYSPTTVTADTVITYVEGPENVGLSSGYYGNCFKLRRETFSFNGTLTTTAQELEWAAPGVGDVKAATVDDLGTVTVMGELSSYQAP